MFQISLLYKYANDFYSKNCFCIIFCFSNIKRYRWSLFEQWLTPWHTLFLSIEWTFMQLINFIFSTCDHAVLVDKHFEEFVNDGRVVKIKVFIASKSKIKMQIVKQEQLSVWVQCEMFVLTRRKRMFMFSKFSILILLICWFLWVKQRVI